MRIVIQRVKEAYVSVEGTKVAAIGKGALVFVGIHKDGRLEDTTWLAQKLTQLRFFHDSQGKMNLSLKEVHGELLIVSQFTLYADCTEGRRPDFGNTAPASVARPIYEKFVKEVQVEFPNVQTGVFGAEMEVGLVNDGPITFILDGKNRLA